MALYTYTGTLADLGGVPFPGALPRLWVEADRDTFGPDGPIPARKRVIVNVATDGTFSVSLTASTETSPPVRYFLLCEWLDQSSSPVGFAQWEFTAYMGGGPIKDGAQAPLSVWWVGPPWPQGTPPGLYVNKVTNWVGEKR